jgi:20S proteasome alpha/beta subunit
MASDTKIDTNVEVAVVTAEDGFKVYSVDNVKEILNALSTAA